MTIKLFVFSFIIFLICSCSNKIKVVMHGYVNNFEEWVYGDEHILIEFNNEKNKIPDSLACCGNIFILYGKFNGTKTYDFNDEFSTTRRIYQYDSFFLHKPYTASVYDTIKKETVIKKYE